ncbi:MAG: LAGLIDADG family homing endonuclease [bacterium]|nr:LAGLIDADG family homing endonuclease [bacterium]
MERLKRFKVETRTIQEGKALTKPRFARKDFDGTQSDKAYLIGFRLGDLHIRKTHPNAPTIQVSTNSTRKEQVELMGHLFNIYGHVKITGPDKQGATNIRCYLNRSFSFLVLKSEKIESWILKSKRCSLAFLAGYIDAEGSFGLSYGKQPFFSMKSQDKEIMAAIQSQILPLLEIHTKLHFVRAAGSVMNDIRCNKDVFGIFIYNRRDLGGLLSALLPSLKHAKRKRDALKVFNFINNVRT